MRDHLELIRRTAHIAVGLVALATGPLAFQAEAPADEQPFPADVSKKGLQVQLVDDALALGLGHAALNVELGSLLEVRPEAAPRVDEAAFAGLDARVRALSEAGVVVHLILLARETGRPAIDELLLHPERERPAPNRLAAWNVREERGRALLTHVLEALAERYARGGPHGRVWGWIVGNEVNAHRQWHNQGRASFEEVVADYERAVRLVHEAVSARAANARVYLSLEHHWAHAPASWGDGAGVGARPFLRAFAARSRSRGDFAWHVAHHPYPENLFDPQFWEDASATHSPAAERVTPRNLDVLYAELEREELRFAGAPRRVLFSEQGFHCPEGAAGERLQAAALAALWRLVGEESRVDGFVLHRHVDHAHEGGLRLGLWARRADSVCAPERRRLAWEVWRACDTEDEARAHAFALDVLGVESWGAWRAGL